MFTICREYYHILSQLLAREYRNTCVYFDLVIDEFIFGPFSFAGAVPEVNFIPAIFAKEGFDCRD